MLTLACTSDARAAPVEASAAGTGKLGSSPTDNLTRTHRMTLDEARMILNLDAKAIAEASEEGRAALEKVSAGSWRDRSGLLL